MPIKTQIWAVSGQLSQLKECILPSEQLLEEVIVNAPRLVSDAVTSPRRTTPHRRQSRLMALCDTLKQQINAATKKQSALLNAMTAQT